MRVVSEYSAPKKGVADFVRLKDGGIGHPKTDPLSRLA
jgi:hypothetical protein